MLEKIGKEMREYAIAHPRLNNENIGDYQHRLTGDLVITLFLDRQHFWRLSLAREGKAPSATEVKTVRRDFGVLEDAVESQHTNGAWQIVRLAWKEAAQEPLFEVSPKETETYYNAD